MKAGYGVSTKVLAVGLEMLPPVLFAHGSHEQRLRYLPPSVRGDETWCQLLSEPDAGSDLGSAKSFAAAVSGGWSVSGQKVWTSGAGTSDFALLIARTDREVSGMGGLSCFLLSMAQPGIEVRPLRQMSGAYHFNEVFLQDAFVPAESLVGQLGEARAILRTMLASERAAIGGGTSARSAQQLMQLARRLRRHEEAMVRQEISEAYIREKVLDLTQQRIAAGAHCACRRISREAHVQRACAALCQRRGVVARPSSRRGRFARRPGLEGEAAVRAGTPHRGRDGRDPAEHDCREGAVAAEVVTWSGMTACHSALGPDSSWPGHGQPCCGGTGGQ